MPLAHQAPTENALEELLGNPALARLIVYYTVRPRSRIHFRELKRRLGLANRSLQLQLARLTDLAMLGSVRSGQKKLFFRRAAHPAWIALAPLVRSLTTPEDLFVAALIGDIESEEAAYRLESGGLRPRVRLTLVGPERLLDREVAEGLSRCASYLGRGLRVGWVERPEDLAGQGRRFPIAFGESP